MITGHLLCPHTEDHFPLPVFRSKRRPKCFCLVGVSEHWTQPLQDIPMMLFLACLTTHVIPVHRVNPCPHLTPSAEKRNAGNTIRSSVKSDEQKIKDARRGPLAPFPNQKSEAAEPPKTPPPSCDSTNTVVAKQALKKPLKGKQAPRKK